VLDQSPGFGHVVRLGGISADHRCRSRRPPLRRPRRPSSSNARSDRLPDTDGWGSVAHPWGSAATCSRGVLRSPSKRHGVTSQCPLIASYAHWSAARSDRAHPPTTLRSALLEASRSTHPRLAARDVDACPRFRW
jgi:hypothetical protein